MTRDVTKKYALTLDKQDELHSYRKEFYIQPDHIYFDGNSLGLLSKRAETKAMELLDSWKSHAIDGWTSGDQPWFYLSERLGEMCAPLVGAKHEEVVITGSTTTNLHQLVATFYQPVKDRTKILADELNFPSDIYALKSQLLIHGFDPAEHLIQVKSADGHLLDEEAIITAMTEEVALIVLPSVLYRSGQILNVKRLTMAAHEKGILIGFDLCHSIGAIPHALTDWDVDFAFWCTYKHLNGGPGAVGGLYVNEKHFGMKPGLAGWFGSHKEKQFDMDHTMSPAPDAGAYQIGTPHVLSAAPLLGSLTIFQEIGIERIRKKSLQLTAYMMMLVEERLGEFGFQIANPYGDTQRGAHIFLQHREAASICKALKNMNVVPDFRAPSGIRLAPVALYNTFSEVWDCVDKLHTIMDKELYRKFTNTRDVIA
ncbi:kynureninase [Virgibacillus soli]|uniref:kynureninase n=1 Tax=Paracerasibacillus soli TaxID=480284 RepID=UPI0035E7486F